MQSIIDECAICLDELDLVKNRATTECGHCFHTSCLIKHSVLTNIVCPLCRTDLADIPDIEDDGDDSDEDSYSESDATTNSDATEEEEPVLQRRTITQILSVMARENITNRHLVSALITTTFQQGWINRHFVYNEADDREDDVMEVIDNIAMLPVDHRDTRRYSDVLLNMPAVSEAGAGPTIA